MIKLIPSKPQFKKWSMPNKVGYISFVLAVLLSVIFPMGIYVYNKIIKKYQTRQEHINLWFASGLWNMNNQNTKEAKCYFHKILKSEIATSYTKQQCAIWNLSLMNFDDDILSKDEIDYCFNFFSIDSDSENATKLILYRILPLIRKDSLNKAIVLYNQIEGYNHRYSKQLRFLSQINSPADSILSYLLANKYDFDAQYNEHIFDDLVFTTVANAKNKK